MCARTHDNHQTKPTTTTKTTRKRNNFEGEEVEEANENNMHFHVHHTVQVDDIVLVSNMHFRFPIVSSDGFNFDGILFHPLLL